MHNRTRWLTAFLAGALVGCQMQEEVAGTPTESRIIGCDEWGCGGNSAWLGEGIVFHELDAAGGFNDANVAIVNFLDGRHGPTTLGQPMTLEVKGDNWIGDSPAGSLSGDGLVYSTVLLKHSVLGGPSNLYRLRIVDYGTTNFWDEPTTANVPIYKVVFQAVTSADDPIDPSKELPLCAPPPKDGWNWGSFSGWVLVFRGDRYVSTTKKVRVTGASDSWFNMACAGTATAKMHLLRHTNASSVDHVPPILDHPTSQPQRQAILKMLVADYCGDGTVWTVNGTPLHYDWNEPWGSPYPITGGVREAVWTEHGARCLTTPRLPTTPSMWTQYPTGTDTRSLVDCPLPTCLDSDFAGSVIPHVDSPGATSYARSARPY